MEAYFVRVLTEVLIGVSEKPSISIWVVCAKSVEEAKRIVAGRISGDQAVQGVNPAPPGTAERFKLAPGRARLVG
jgi:hypothetical protein